MALLADQDRFDCWADLMRSADLGSCSIVKTDLRAAIDAADAWANTNAASFNTALPLAARNGLTAPQKALLLMFVVGRRWLKGA